ncbi:energy transducer TonB [Heliorestis convoluta]|uniref:Energy transducer TonB n=1 Tax=Heliorestis convoluta TaxID=356322 RepID=A0A5Q2N218_9FIRM|nr:energy transducer TonB [Heliorestis convoluta]QGG46585.1 energy transducer TonB [Heliorestis convoluta]
MIDIFRKSMGLTILFIFLFQLVLFPTTLYGDAMIYSSDHAMDRSRSVASARITIDARDVELRDLFSALALKMGTTIVLVDDIQQKVDLQVKNIPLRDAFDLLINKNGLAYLEQGTMILIGQTGNLHTHFYDQMFLQRFDLVFVKAPVIRSLINELNIPVKSLLLQSNENAIWVQGTVQELHKVRELIYVIDRIENEAIEEEESDETEVVEPFSLEYRIITTTQIPPERVLQLLTEMGIHLERYLTMDQRLLVFDQELFEHWEEIEKTIAELDTIRAREQTVFVYPLKNIVAGDAAAWLNEFNFGPDVRVVPNNADRFSKEILVISPPHKESTVRGAIERLDRVGTKIRLPVEDGNDANVLNARRSLLSELSGVPVSSFRISRDIGPVGNPRYILWVEETPDKIQLIKDLNRQVNNPN